MVLIESPKPAKYDGRHQQREGNGRKRDECRADIQEKQEQNDHDQQAAVSKCFHHIFR